MVIFHLTGESLFKIRENGYIKRLPQITKEEINDHGKSDIFTKLITAVQVFSFIIQVIVRHSRNLAISQLELAVTAFSVCAMVIYFLTLYQPKGVQAIRILCNDGRDLSFDEAYEICVTGRSERIFGSLEARSYFLRGGVDLGISNYDTRGVRRYSMVIGVLLGGTVFGAVHCCGWFFAFPTVQELLLWRIASVLTTTAPAIIICITWLEVHFKDWISDILILAGMAIMFLYSVARLFIIVEVFRSLFYLPSDAFISTWADNIPHVS
jgi:hypothetical protein